MHASKYAGPSELIVICLSLDDLAAAPQDIVNSPPARVRRATSFALPLDVDPYPVGPAGGRNEGGAVANGNSADVTAIRCVVQAHVRRHFRAGAIEYIPKVEIRHDAARCPGRIGAVCSHAGSRTNPNAAVPPDVATIRGFRANGGMAGLRVYADGTPDSMPDGSDNIPNFSYGSGDRIDVLRGPFSALYGNSSGGVFQVFTTDGSNPPEVLMRVGGGSYGTLTRYSATRHATVTGLRSCGESCVRFQTSPNSTLSV